ncbi:MAG: hypothetical protein JSS11_09515 [Verrucomicrobia bacterium]|nr:hypothetical protein [Verrucomicrobiota bacterium]
MKIRLPLLALCLGLLTLGAPLQTFAKDAKGEAAETEGKKNITVIVLTAKPEAIHAAALQALAGIGCEVKKDTPTAIEGKRSNKMGLAVGSGGEKLFVDLKDKGDGKTEVRVTTKKTMLGYVGQKLWNEEVAKQISDAVAAK